MRKFSLAFLLVVLTAIAVSAKPSDYIYEVGMARIGQEQEVVEESGSAVLLDPAQGIYVTAHHTVERGSRNTKLMVDVNGVLMDVRILAVSKLHDLVLFQGPTRLGAGLLPKIEFAVAKKETVSIAHALMPTVQGMRPTERKGVVLKTTNWTIVTSSEGQQGMSGGAVFSQDGKLLGVISGMDDATKGILGPNANAIEFFLTVAAGAKGKKPFNADEAFAALTGG